MQWHRCRRRHEEYIQCIGEDGPCGHTDVLASSLSVGENTTGNDAHGTVDHGQQQGDDDDAQRDGTLGILGDSGHRDGSHRSALAGKTHHGQSGDETSETAVEEAAVSAGKGAGKINLGNAENNKQCKRSYQNQSNDVSRMVMKREPLMVERKNSVIAMKATSV